LACRRWSSFFDSGGDLGAAAGEELVEDGGSPSEREVEDDVVCRE
jgi:hypothetical protein